VPIRTEVESINTEGAMGAFMFTIMAAVGQLEAEMGQERAASARAARRERHAAAGLSVPSIIATYGRKHVTSDGLTRIVPDPERPIEPVLAGTASWDRARRLRATAASRQPRAAWRGRIWPWQIRHNPPTSPTRSGILFHGQDVERGHLARVRAHAAISASSGELSAPQSNGTTVSVTATDHGAPQALPDAYRGGHMRPASARR